MCIVQQTLWKVGKEQDVERSMKGRFQRKAPK